MEPTKESKKNICSIKKEPTEESIISDKNLLEATKNQPIKPRYNNLFEATKNQPRNPIIDKTLTKFLFGI